MIAKDKQTHFRICPQYIPIKHVLIPCVRACCCVFCFEFQMTHKYQTAEKIGLYIHNLPTSIQSGFPCCTPLELLLED